MAEQTSQERTEQATPRKLQKARERGQVAKSAELNSVIIIGMGFLSIYLLGPMIMGNISAMMRHVLTEAPNIQLTPGSIHQFFSDKVLNFAAIMGPIMIALAMFAYMVNVAQVGVMFAPKSLEPKWDKFNIPKGISKLLSKQAGVNLIRDVLKAVIIAFIAYKTIDAWMPDIMETPDKSIANYASSLGQLAMLLAIRISLVLLVLAIFDFAFQRYQHSSQLKMTRQEVKEEFKETEGSPQLKSRIRQVQREFARQRMMQEIPKADVVVTNPTHIAVALKYDADIMPAPMVVAKGERLMAEKIKEIALEHKVPIIENKPLARSLFRMVDIGKYIPSDLYKTAAEVLAYVYRIKNRGVNNG